MSFSWIIKRLFLIIPSLIGVSFLTFIIASKVPGDPVYALVGERADSKIIESYRSKMGLDKGIVTRYCLYLKMILTGDLGLSYYSGRSVSKDLMEKFPNTLLLAFWSMLFSSIGGIVLGIYCALYPNTFADKVILLFSTLCISLPVFWFGMLLVYFFSFKIHIFPVAGMNGALYFVLPSITLGLRSLGYVVRLTKSCMLEVLNAEYIMTVKAKGGGILRIIYHAFINAVIPIVTFIGLDFGSYLNGSVLTETIFGWNGIGRYAINGILKRDYPVILGTVLFGAFVFMLINILVDIICVLLNPKLRLKGK
ncbi:MAG: hypothetical protein ACD_79C00764G0002 [uncultured bacterium]|nr:MAG: hypothetical protein ACD_79C00764G0002 [uncultured bacterium]